MTPELAHNLEHAEAQHLARQVHEYARQHVGEGARTIDVAGGIAALTTAAFGRKLNHVTGFGLGAAASEDELAALEAAYAGLGLATEIDICPYIGADALQLLGARGYVVNAFSNTFVKTLRHGSTQTPPVSGVQIVGVNADNAEVFFSACVAGFSVQTQQRPVALLEALARVALARSDTRLYLALADGVVAGSAGLGLLDGIAHLYVASTLPHYRGRGIQQALLQARLEDAKREGCTLASITARPSNVSARNALRAGFELAYTKTTLVRGLQSRQA
ncbi:GNAT family N-acetyltransferase [Undibacterium sp.]|uniref:GNAT family N-acetyltransferase n=1 Tax=Undibacterium sp. TaxID=1914977 RepID=UPI00374DD49C